MEWLQTDIHFDAMLYLLVDLHERNVHEVRFPQTYTLYRTTRCPNLDIKLQLKLILNYDLQMNDEAGEPARFLLSTKWSLSTDCINLRRNRNIFSTGDVEFILFSTEVIRDATHDDLRAMYSTIVQYLIDRLDDFKLCIECRGLYLDRRHRALHEMQCIQCLFDRTFILVDLTCAICKEPVHANEQTYSLTCGHAFHSHCILLHFIKNKKRDCPLCREVDTSA